MHNWNKMQEAKHMNAVERNRTAEDFKYGAHLMKRCVSLSEVARYHWSHGAQTRKKHANMDYEDQRKFWKQNLSIQRVFLLFIINMNFLSRKSTSNIPIESSHHAQH